MNYLLLKKHLPSESIRIKGIYATKKAVEFIKNKLESRKEKEEDEFIIEPTELPLRPESSHRVDKYLSTLFLNQPE